MIQEYRQDMATNVIKSMIIGAAKAGTSSLLRYLAQHPDICTHQQSEMSFFVLDWEYQTGYSTVFNTYFDQCDSEGFFLAKSAELLYRQDAVLKLRAHNPDIHLIIMLRNPIERAYSSFWFEKRRGREQAATFEDALSSNSKRVQVEWRQEKNCMYLEQSRYIDYLPFIFDTFDKKQIHIYLMEDVKKDAVGVCQEIYKYFGLNAEFTPDIMRRHNSAAKVRSESMAHLMVTPSIGKRLARLMVPNKIRWYIKQRLTSMNETPFSPPPIKPETRKKLLAHFDPYNRQLADMLQRDLNHWR